MTGKAADTTVFSEMRVSLLPRGCETSAAGQEGRLGGGRPRGISKTGLSCSQSLDITLDQMHRLVANK